MQKMTKTLRNKSVVLAWRILLVIAGTIGLVLAFQPFGGRPRWDMFCFFTNLSNLAAVLFFIALIIREIRGRKDHRRFWRVGKGTATMGLVVTALIAWLLLKGFDMRGTIGLSLILLHRVTPILAVLDWLFFDKKGEIHRFDPLFWLCWPLAYFAVTMIAVPLMRAAGGQADYPYPFIDVDSLGLAGVLLNAVLILIGFIVLGYIIYGIDHWLGRMARCRVKNMSRLR